MAQMIPSLWFHTDDGTLQEVFNYYKKAFESSFANKTLIPLGETPGGNSEMAEVSFFNNRYFFMATSQEHHPFNDAFSLTLLCKNQAEIDHYWDYFVLEGKEAPCGWCMDKYGLRWQIIPDNMGSLMSHPHAWKIMMNQKKIIISEYL